ncbi:putative disease resistance protein RGA1 [Lolium rigidum]|uniref:putative disease resistance protein RGA1 n=1 Tax=Lolium rigidum TaxID=89674 RepID=UPI001F5CD2D9|nr:putative disease resistance protein RGA1 [Lolium rigidum]
MAEVLISAVVGDMVGRVISLLASRCSNQEQSTDDKLQKISRMLIRINTVVEEAKGRHITNHVALDWLSDLDDGVWQGRYLLDTVGCRDTEHEEDEDGDGEEVQPFSLSLFNPAKRVRVAACTVRCVLSGRSADLDEIHRVLENLQGLSGDLREFLMLLQGCNRIRRPLATNIFVDNGQMFGRHVEREKIINFLLHDDYSLSPSKEKLPLLPIVGDIGVGKTTLVQHVCDDARLRSRFPLIMLFNFSSTYAIALGETAVVLKSKHVIGGSGNLKHPLHVLNESFRSKRFLMVFEDVDMHKKKMLEELLPSLRRHGKQGSKIIVTTNNMRVAASMGTMAPIRLKVLPHPEYWFFFKAHAFAATDVEENPRLLAVGTAIARKLNGSFFGAKIVGGVLRAHPNLQLWCRILRSDIGGLSLLGDGLGYIADLAENLLPSHVSMRQLIITKKPFRSTQPKFAMFHDMFLPSPDDAPESCSADVGNAKVLLCRSVLPFYCVYYTMLIAL